MLTGLSNSDKLNIEVIQVALFGRSVSSLLTNQRAVTRDGALPVRHFERFLFYLSTQSYDVHPMPQILPEIFCGFVSVYRDWCFLIDIPSKVTQVSLE